MAIINGTNHNDNGTFQLVSSVTISAFSIFSGIERNGRCGHDQRT